MFSSIPPSLPSPPFPHNRPFDKLLPRTGIRSAWTKSTTPSAERPVHGIYESHRDFRPGRAGTRSSSWARNAGYLQFKTARPTSDLRDCDSFVYFPNKNNQQDRRDDWRSSESNGTGTLEQREEPPHSLHLSVP